MAEIDFDSEVTMAGGERTLLAGRYRIVRQLGRGGMGSVWLAEDIKLDNKLFAIKMLPSILIANKRAYRQLKDEALVAMKLVHPNIVTLRAFEETDGNPFLVMDYIEGKTLDECLEEWGKLSEEQTVALLNPIAAAIDYAHSEGVVHRDIKPGNIMIRSDGKPFILDFGIAREVKETLTQVTGKLSSGTLLYMSPEQLTGDMPKPAQDVYSFAAMAYECINGAPPFSRGQVEYQIIHKEPEPLPEGSGITASIMRGLDKTPDTRPKTCTGVLRALQRPQVKKTVLPIKKAEALKTSVKSWGVDWVSLAFIGIVILGFGGRLLYQTYQDKKSADRKIVELQRNELARQEDARKAEAKRQEEVRQAEEQRKQAELKRLEEEAARQKEEAELKKLENTLAELQAERDQIEKEERLAKERKAKEEAELKRKKDEAEQIAREEAARVLRQNTQAALAAFTATPPRWEEGYRMAKVADQENSSLQFYLGVCFENGYGVAQDYAEAKKWYLKAAEQGHADAQNNLGTMFFAGSGMSGPDYEQAVSWFRKAANQGQIDALYNIGVCYENGYGVSQDKLQAYHGWYRAAANKGHAAAQSKLNQLETAQKKSTPTTPAPQQYQSARSVFPAQNSSSGIPWGEIISGVLMGISRGL